MRVPFRVFPDFNEDRLRWAARSTFRVDRKSAPSFRGHPLAERIVRALAERRAINVKELLESFETFDRVRRRVRSGRMADLCCGHGLTGLLFAAAERRVHDVVLLDRTRSKNAELVTEAVYEAAPWAREKVRWVEADVKRATDHLAPGTAIIGVHACGTRTDRVLETAMALDGPVAVIPCCYKQTAKRVPRALRDALGAELATDVHRTYELEARGFRVEWAAIPDAITPMNRVLIGRPHPSKVGSYA